MSKPRKYRIDVVRLRQSFPKRVYDLLMSAERKGRRCQQQPVVGKLKEACLYRPHPIRKQAAFQDMRDGSLWFVDIIGSAVRHISLKAGTDFTSVTL